MSIKTKYLKIVAYIVLSLLLYILLPVYLTTQLAPPPIKLLFLFYLVNFLFVFYLFKKDLTRRRHLEFGIRNLQEKINILFEQNSQESENKAALQGKIKRYDNLKNIIEEINQNLDLDSIADTLVRVAFSLIANNRGTCVLYLVDNQTYKLNLFKTKKEDENLIVKTKEGDIFDLWVLRHTSPLLIEDTKKDFRFDLAKLETQDLRSISSLIIAPFISEHKFLGILRLDNPSPSFYAQHDLRFLVAICDFGAIALENSELFQKTRDLAIHDGLTLLYTKGYFLERLKEECRRNLRQNKTLSLLMLDIDYFKNYNDKFGHAAGDIVLKNLSHNMDEFLKDSGSIISRFGGEEFCIMMPHLDKKKAYTIANQLCERIEKTKIILRGQNTNITVSIGVAAYPVDAGNEDELIFKADRAMYEAKQQGRNRVAIAV